MERFSDLDRITSGIHPFQNPFDFKLDDVPVGLQLVFIDLQANSLLKEQHGEGKLVEYYRCSPNNVFSNWKKFAFGMALVFGSTYVCEVSTSNDAKT